MTIDLPSVFSLKNSKVHCKKHATLNEYGYENRHPICHELHCHEPATCIEANDNTIYPVRCTNHRQPTDIELINRPCPSCEEVVYYPSNQEVCMECGQYRELLIRSLREEAVKRALIAANIEFIHDKQIFKQGSRYRPDFRIPAAFGFIIAEVDENQHKYSRSKENKRMITIYHDAQIVAPKCQVVFLRFNPDGYDGPVMVDLDERLTYLLQVITSLLHQPSFGTPLGYINLFYDGFDGAPRFNR